MVWLSQKISGNLLRGVEGGNFGFEVVIIVEVILIFEIKILSVALLIFGARIVIEHSTIFPNNVR